jgi:hypothetical protein
MGRNQIYEASIFQSGSDRATRTPNSAQFGFWNANETPQEQGGIRFVIVRNGQVDHEYFDFGAIPQVVDVEQGFAKGH